MGSLDKIKPDTGALAKFIKKYKGPYVMSDKLDGVSGLFVKKKNTFKLYTRGDGEYGKDVSHLIPYVISSNIKLNDIPLHSAIRGEFIISKNNFEKIKNDFKNARAVVSGLINSKKYSKKIAKLTEFIAYAVIYPKFKQDQQMEQLKVWNFPAVAYEIKNKISNDYLSEYFSTRRKTSAYDIDGIVVIDNGKIYKHENKNPSYGFAFKKVLTDQIAEVTIVDVEWNLTKDGYLKPRIQVDTVVLGGVEINYTTGFNAKYIFDNKLGPGAVVKLVRSGDVIPYILEIIKPSANGKPKMPDISYKWNKTGVDIIVKDIHSAAHDNIIVKQMLYFFKTLKVKHISEGIIRKLVNNGYNSIFKLLSANREELHDIDGLGVRVIDKIYDNFYEAINSSTLYRLMAASGQFGRGFGVKRLKLITDAYPNIIKKKWDKYKIKNKVVELEGFDILTAKQFANNFNKFLDFFNHMKNYINLDHLLNSKSTKSSNIFENQKIVFTGFRDKNLEEYVENNGGKISGNVSKNTTLVVYVQPEGKPVSSKLKKAKLLNIDLMTKDNFIKKYNIIF